MPKLKSLSYDELKQLVNSNGFNWALIAKTVQVSNSYVTQVAQKKSKNIKVARAIAIAAKTDFQKIFGISEADYEESCLLKCNIPASEAEKKQTELATALAM